MEDRITPEITIQQDVIDPVCGMNVSPQKKIWRPATRGPPITSVPDGLSYKQHVADVSIVTHHLFSLRDMCINSRAVRELLEKSQSLWDRPL